MKGQDATCLKKVPLVKKAKIIFIQEVFLKKKQKTISSKLKILFLCRLSFTDVQEESSKRELDSDQPKSGKFMAEVEPHVIPNRGPYPYNLPKKYVCYIDGIKQVYILFNTTCISSTNYPLIQ